MSVVQRTLIGFKTKLSWGWVKPKGRIKSEEEKLASVRSCSCFTLNWFYMGLCWLGARLMLFHSQPVLCCFSLWFPCSHQAGAAAWVSALWHKQEKMAGAESHWVVAPELLGQFFFEQPVSTDIGFTLLFAAERFWILLKAFPNQPPTCLLYVHSLWLVLKHLVFALQHMSFLRALMHLSSQINVTERKSYKLPWTDSRLLNPRPAIKSLQCLVVSSLFFRSFIIYSMCLAVWYFITAGGGWQTRSQESVSSLASETLQNLRLLGANPMLF